MHHLSVIFAVLSILILSVLAAPLSSNQSLDKRQGFKGRGTWFWDQVAESACSTWNMNGDPIVAISAQIFGSGGHCGHGLWITANGVTQYARVGDECQGCGPNDLDMSHGLFGNFASPDVGVLSIQWGWDN